MFLVWSNIYIYILKLKQTKISKNIKNYGLLFSIHLFKISNLLKEAKWHFDISTFPKISTCFLVGCKLPNLYGGMRDGIF